jgi:hypothetical protein
MRKIFTFLFAALMSVGMYATTEVTITQADFPQHGKSFTKDGVTVSAGLIDGMQGNITGPGSFSTTLGNFTKIEVTASDVSIFGPGWNGNPGKKTWTGNASSLSFNGSIMGMGMGVTLKFTIAEPTVAVTGVTLNQNEAQMTVGGETLTLTATVNPNNATDQSVSWSTSDANVATVENGVVTAVAAGNATITVTTTDGSFTATCAVTVTAPEPQGETIVVTITDSDFPGWGDSFTKDGVTVSAEMIDDMYGNISGPGSFSTTLGNFTKIEVNATYVASLGPGWSGDSERQTWTGNASSVSFTGDINGDEEGLTLKFTIESQGGETAVENVQTNHVQATKFFRNGQLLIEKNGKIYNVMGAEVK